MKAKKTAYIPKKYKIKKEPRREERVKKREKKNQIHITITAETKESARRIKMELMRAAHIMNCRMNEDARILITCNVIPSEKRGAQF